MKFPRLDRLVVSVFRTLALGMKGNRVLVTTDVREARLVTCEGCPHFDPVIRQCNLCTCLVDLKVELTAEECPAGRWPDTQLTKTRIYASILKLWRKT